MDKPCSGQGSCSRGICSCKTVCGVEICCGTSQVACVRAGVREEFVIGLGIDHSGRTDSVDERRRPRLLRRRRDSSSSDTRLDFKRIHYDSELFVLISRTQTPPINCRWRGRVSRLPLHSYSILSLSPPSLSSLLPLPLLCLFETSVYRWPRVKVGT